MPSSLDTQLTSITDPNVSSRHGQDVPGAWCMASVGPEGSKYLRDFDDARSPNGHPHDRCARASSHASGTDLPWSRSARLCANSVVRAAGSPRASGPNSSSICEANAGGGGFLINSFRQT
eukprot:2623924-Prymnesium_polylepis.2